MKSELELNRSTKPIGIVLSSIFACSHMLKCTANHEGFRHGGSSSWTRAMTFVAGHNVVQALGKCTLG